MTHDLRRSVPVRVRATGTGPIVEWAYTAGRRFTEPFFEDTLLQMPRVRTSIEEAVEWARANPGLPPTGFVFHMSRCGSTLVSQMLAALRENRVLSEPPALDDVLSLPGIDDEQRIAWLRAIISALGQSSTDVERNFFIKWDCWLTRRLPLIRRAFPDTPWIFLYREPAEVLASQLFKPGAWTVSPDADHGVTREEQCARLLAAICSAAIENVAVSGGGLVNYCQLPEVVCSGLPAWFGISFTPAQCDAMREAAYFDAKSPGLFFSEDRLQKRRMLSAEARVAVERWLRSPYATLEQLRGVHAISTLPTAASTRAR